MTDSLTAEEILAKAADRVEQGWCQHALIRNGNVCALGALCIADGAPETLEGIENHDRSTAYFLARKAILKELEGDCLVGFNNTYGRTKEEVSALFRNAKRRLP